MAPSIFQPTDVVDGAPCRYPTSIATQSADLTITVRAMASSARVVRSCEVAWAHGLSQTQGRMRTRWTLPVLGG
jgi:hypothetical protein